MKKLPEAELEVMDVLWKTQEPLKTSEIVERLNKNWVMSTVQVLLTRLEDKGFAGSKKEKRLKYYYSIINEDDYKKLETEWLYKKIHNSSMKSLIASLIDTEELDDQDISEIEDMLSKLK
ncbi:BlaI/MecI/CopY family transcriptional regulator [Anaerorhabdus furcosa]|uniref:Predicted transcriptional regulator n=1 Tax=Anaerorhabdus furcosa TaxID=118967 RepID=A0A1T4KAG0_9FIRM|nr:BlaI/MecI/CopY family transcriptional regulator [Anaerorhabdus furcosa]SJZ39392.1 Predicted transcriptional regulator [Anaerorhabdus furcosa]